MGVEMGLDLIERLAGVEGLIIVRNIDNELIDHVSQGFVATLQ